MNTWGDRPEIPEDETIDAGSFFPSLSTAEFRRDYRIPAEIPRDLVRDFLKVALIRCRTKLAPWREKQTASCLQQAEQESGEKVELWKRAVFCEAKAAILRETVTVDRKAPAENAAKSAPETAEMYAIASARALRLIAGRGAGTAEAV